MARGGYRHGSGRKKGVPNKKGRRVKTSITLPQDRLDTLDAIAKRAGITRSQAIEALLGVSRTALLGWFSNNSRTAEKA